MPYVVLSDIKHGEKRSKVGLSGRVLVMLDKAIGVPTHGNGLVVCPACIPYGLYQTSF